MFFTVVDFNDCPPEFVNPITDIALPEDVNLNGILQTYTVQDCDSGLNGVSGTRFTIIAGQSTCSQSVECSLANVHMQEMRMQCSN